MKLMWKIGICFVVIFLIVAIVSFWRSGQPDLLEQRLSEAAGVETINCGSVYVMGNRSSADACAVAAFKMQKPFRVRYNDVQQSVPFSYIGGRSSSAIVGTPQGQVFMMYYGCAYWHGFRYNQSVVNYYPEIVVHELDGKLTLGFDRKKE